ncbi:peptide-methionine (S)-S-oxide reductase MsrA [Aciduricibacillus chroicocephali]|uniref:Peptide methionine sulfoxide reductase MsrA n=1 Tax=Aciduricibacillus chroicocephali TaxID=3054939 RepID=A0ABY9KWS7_9BACI|nr:peptide-methionine (S)-S-oxide reductase MsrA [Bacillaceae bacterium 44XB]
MYLNELEKGFQNKTLEPMTFGMGCFWTPESRFGAINGVNRTCVGYAGGTTDNPTYRRMGDHTETIHVEFDPNIISYEDLLRHFWRNHYPNRDEYKGRQYISLLRYHNDGQKQSIENIKQEMEKELGEPIETEIAPFENFTHAEIRHQKYYLKRYPKALEQLNDIIPNEEMLTDSTFAAKLNGFVKAFITRDVLIEEINFWPIEMEAREFLKKRLMHMKW